MQGHVEPTEPFSYNHLAHPKSTIRILTLFPGSFEDPICCQLSHVDLNQSTLDHYEAVSYAWGDQLFLHSIYLCNEELETSKSVRSSRFCELRVVYSVYGALRQFRHENASRKLWIDGICINQKDLQERGHQIQLMRNIYCHARSVLVWLGDYEQAPYSFRKLDSVIVAAAFRHVADIGSYFLGDGVPAVSEDVFLTLVTIYQRPWFRRLWVLQEVLLPRGPIDACLGSQSVDLWKLVQAAVYADRAYADFRALALKDTFDISVWMGPFSLRHVQRSLDSIAFAHMTVPQRAIQVLLATSGRFYCSDEHDKIYGLLGLIGDVAASSDLEPDYTKPVSEFYVDLARYLILASGTLVILAGAISHPEEPNLPSWVPKWDFALVPKFPSTGIPMLSSVTYFEFSKCGKKLSAQLIPLGRIECTFLGAASTDSHSLDSLREHLRTLQGSKDLKSVLANYKNDQGKAADFSDFVLEYLYNDENSNEYYISLFNKFMENKGWGLATLEERKAFADDYTERIGSSSQLFTTSNGYVGICNGRTVRPGDRVYIVPGCIDALALRDEGSGQQIVNNRLDIFGLRRFTFENHMNQLRGWTWEEVVIV